MNRSQNRHTEYGRNQAQSRIATAPSPEAKRREIIKVAALAAGGAAIVSALPAFGQTPAPAAAPPAPAPTPANTNDIGILNFALGLEYLEAEFYTRAVAADAQRQYLRGRLREAASTLRDHENAHVDALIATIARLGGAPIARGTYRFPQDAFISPIAFGRHAVALEAIGVGAYLGAINLIKSRDIRRAAAAIYGTETRHAAIIRHLTGNTFSPRYYEGPLNAAQVQILIASYVV
jgi:hypothetical protein